VSTRGSNKANKINRQYIDAVPQETIVVALKVIAVVIMDGAVTLQTFVP